MDYAKTIERLKAVVGQDVWVLVWSDAERRSPLLQISGRLERWDSQGAQAAQRRQVTENIRRDGVPKEMIEEILLQHELSRTAKRARKAGSRPPGLATSGVVAAAERDSHSARDDSFIVVRAGQTAGRLFFDERDFRSSEYDRDGLTVSLGFTTLTFVGLYRPKRLAAQRRKSK